MSLFIKKYFALFFILFFIANVADAVQAKKPMPPTFSINSEAEEVLQEYPLGIINMEEAFSHHGSPVRKLELPNGNRAWLYSIGRDMGIPNVYILQFSADGIVIDVLHKSLHYKNGHSALQYQFLQNVEPELKMRGPGPGMQ